MELVIVRGITLLFVVAHTTGALDVKPPRPFSSLNPSRPLGARLFYVDEPSCVGCYRCADVAPLTFAMDPAFGRARVVLQGGDSSDLLREAIRTCPSSCIHQVTAGELAVLETWREKRGDAVVYAHRTSSLVGSSTVPPWWAPLRDANSNLASWNPILSSPDRKATIDFMGAPADGAQLENIADEDALTLKHELPRTQPLRLREHKTLVGAACLAFILQGLEILSNSVHC
ncbi:hypothetical protein T492DRAFT_919127 [Pavlovales sp. CCMP2436]|nr:hypothetical protein T492DRAFT_919127 [Pavlovales sp. CCMP2436]